jgi:hypothetical protein
MVEATTISFIPIAFARPKAAFKVWSVFSLPALSKNMMASSKSFLEGGV